MSDRRERFARNIVSFEQIYHAIRPLVDAIGALGRALLGDQQTGGSTRTTAERSVIDVNVDSKPTERASKKRKPTQEDDDSDFMSES